jgi:hypothetical protein
MRGALLKRAGKSRQITLILCFIVSQQRYAQKSTGVGNVVHAPRASMHTVSMCRISPIMHFNKEPAKKRSLLSGWSDHTEWVYQSFSMDRAYLYVIVF